mgnify:FL=1
MPPSRGRRPALISTSMSPTAVPYVLLSFPLSFFELTLSSQIGNTCDNDYTGAGTPYCKGGACNLSTWISSFVPPFAHPLSSS